MMSSGKILDPICDMTVDLADARAHGLALQYPNREYAFCSAACQAKFAKDPSAHATKVEAWIAAQVAATEGGYPHTGSPETPVIDAGMRAWYSSCRCCLSDAHPSVVEALDLERAQMQVAPVDAGI